MQVDNTTFPVPLYINLSASAEKGLRDTFNNYLEFIQKKTFKVHIERDKGREATEEYINIFLDSDSSKLEEYIGNKTLKFRCIIKPKSIFIASVNETDKYSGMANSRRLSVEVNFFMANSYEPVPPFILEKIRALPFPGEQSVKVQKQLETWNVYIDILKRNAEDNEVTILFEQARISENFKYLHLFSNDINDIDIRKFQNAKTYLSNTIMKSNANDDRIEIGVVETFNRKENEVIIELDEYTSELYKKNKWSAISFKYLVLSNYGDWVQVKRLEYGIKQLKQGKAANPNLENILFGELPFQDTSMNSQTFSIEEGLQSELNKYQSEAVKGAMEAEDYYLIQGPPGTGKTTVIAEICYQNAIRGLKTLVASQSNLAVDNALNRLFHDPKVRVLRKGRTNSIEPEGAKFIIDNIASTWQENTIQNMEEKIVVLKQELVKQNKLKEKINLTIQQENEYFNTTLDTLSLFNKLNKDISHINREIQKKRAQIESLNMRYSVKSDNLQNKQNQYTKLSVLREGNQFEINWMKERKELLDQEKLYLENLEYLKREKEYNFIKAEYETLKAEKMDRLKSYNSYKSIISNGEVLSKISEIDYNLDRELKSNTTLIRENEQEIKDLSFDIEISKETIIDQKHKLYELQQRKESINSDVIGEGLFNTLRKGINDSRIEFINKRIIYQKKYIDELELELRSTKLTSINLKNKKNELMNTKEELYREAINAIEAKAIEFKQEASRIDNQLLEQNNKINTLASFLKRVKKERFNQSDYQLNIKIKEVQESLTNYQNLEKSRNDYQKNISNLEVEMTKLLYDIRKINNSISEIDSNILREAKILEEKQSAVDDIIMKNDIFKSNYQEISEDQFIRKFKLKMVSLRISLNGFDEKIEKLNDELQLSIKWLSMLRSADEDELKDVKRLYIKHANIIGTTCNQTATKEFSEDYPDFDVVIIDEVSKATPPELLLPMLKGKKVILVGDHHQLPPMIGQETLDEVINEIPDGNEKEEAREIITTSVFERLFENAPKTNKSTLRVQYRMHVDIMNNITQFYENKLENNEPGLISGLTDPNNQRDHQMQGEFIQRGQHVMWFDTPNSPSYFEQRDKDSTSYYNRNEIEIILKLLEDMENSVQKAKNEGRIDEASIKEVGIITFYGEQVKKIKEALKGKDYQHINTRVGTIDRFQGIEKEVIIASFVRNHNNSNGNIGFSRNYQRLNVALSRAQELLIIIGSSSMFTVNVKDDNARKMYSKVVNNIRQLNGMRDYYGRRM